MKTRQETHIVKWDELNNAISLYQSKGFWVESITAADEKRDNYILLFKTVVKEEDE